MARWMADVDCGEFGSVSVELYGNREMAVETIRKHGVFSNPVSDSEHQWIPPHVIRRVRLIEQSDD